ncbi:hypothetical protein KSB_66800 [Ktedonobacter robiniae]|uniref:Uncharacterized protein n=1 Tax=Ktedonobacter robiniae TaxID=2778365 RepID=A0ABQ3V0P8_9CHLR|nr:hypothetical protein KSB_66800 [Ktedonobacter robiniae]
MGQGALTSRLTRAIDIKDHPLTSLSIHQASSGVLVRERAAEEIIEKECAQSFDGCLSQRCQKA